MKYLSSIAFSTFLWIVFCLVVNHSVLFAQQANTRSLNMLGDGFVLAVDDSISTMEDEQVSFNVLSNDLGDSLKLQSIWAVASKAFLFYNADGSVNYKPQLNLFGTDTLRYIVSNQSASPDTATVVIYIEQVNDFPISQPDFIEIYEDSGVVIFPLKNDMDPDKSGLVILSTSVPSNGNLVFGSGVLDYTPNRNYFGADTIIYNARENAAGRDAISDTIFITILSVNDKPIVVSDTLYGLEEDTLYAAPLTNDFDIDSDLDSLSFHIETPPVNGIVRFDTSTWVLYYIPEPNYYGNDSLFYSVKDAQGAKSEIVKIPITVKNVNDVPIASNDQFTIKNTDTLVYNPLENDVDLDSSGIKVISVLYSNLGSVAWTNDNIIYSPDRFVEGVDTLTYYIIDGDGDVDSAMCYLTILQANEPPVSHNDTVNVNISDTIWIDVLGNDTDDQSDLTVSDINWILNPNNGQIVVFETENKLAFISDDSFFDRDSAWYEVNDELDSVAMAWVYFIDIDSVLDNDKDGLANILEGRADPDNDGIEAFLDKDSDNDSIADGIEGAEDIDNDSVANYLDDDSDGDGILDIEEGALDIDIDSLANFIDLDSDGDNILDAEETSIDSDGDLISNYLDLDSDNDLIADSEEGTVDTDGDGLGNYIDNDSDNDGISDLVEGGEDIDFDGLANYLDDDSDGDNILDVEETTIDSDSDLISNYLDLDSDNDLISDSEEGTVDTDGDGLGNYIDNDSDNDGISDLVEGDADYDNDGLANYLDLDSDDDIILDQTEGVSDTDNDGLFNFIDDDSDGDGIIDLIEGEEDTDGDQIPNYLDPFIASDDTDGDGSLDGSEDIDKDGNPYNDDCDADGLPNYVDFEDGCQLFVTVSNGFSPNNDGVNDYFDIDGLEAFLYNDLQVFNRWGSLVYQESDYGALGNSSWWNGESNRGVYKGNELPEGVYYYVLSLRNGRYLVSGFVDLRR